MWFYNVLFDDIYDPPSNTALNKNLIQKIRIIRTNTQRDSPSSETQLGLQLFLWAGKGKGKEGEGKGKAALPRAGVCWLPSRTVGWTLQLLLKVPQAL